VFSLEPSKRSYPYRAERPAAEEMAAAHPDSAPVAFSLALLGDPGAARRALELEPSMLEAHLVLGLGERRRAPGRAEEHLHTAADALPRSVSANLGLADVLFALEDYPAALRQYRQVMALAPAHRDAQLRIGVALSLLGQPEESIAALQKLIELGNWHLGEAHYWLAVDRQDLGQLEQAERDAELAKRWLPGDPRVHALSGSLALERGDASLAEERFTRAITAADALPSQWAGDDAVCESHYALGVIASRRESWLDGRASFERASQCRKLAGQRVEQSIETIRGWSLPEQRQQALLAGKSRLLARVTLEDAGAEYNAAVCAFRAGQNTAARELAQRAGRHEAYAEKSQDLMAKLQ
jgi:tetratricopeptide (TPR) repeat protein